MAIYIHERADWPKIPVERHLTEWPFAAVVERNNQKQNARLRNVASTAVHPGCALVFPDQAILTSTHWRARQPRAHPLARQFERECVAVDDQ
jgi:hypothetical protein